MARILKDDKGTIKMAGRVIKGIGWTAIGSITRNIVNLLQIIVLTRFLEKSDFGIIAIATVFVAFTMLFLDMGISAGILYKKEISNYEYSSLFWFNILVGIGLTAILFFLTPLLTRSYHSSDLTSIVRLLCFNIFFSSLGAQQRAFCQKKMYFRRLALIEIIGGLTTLLVAVITAVSNYGVYSLALSSFSGCIVLNCLHFIIALLKDSRIGLYFNFYDIVPFVKIGIFQIGSSILDFLTREMDVIIISTTLGMEFLGVYNIAKRIPTAVYTLIQPIVGTVFTPLLAEINHDLYLVKSKYVSFAKIMSFVSLPLYFGLAASSELVLKYVFGPNYMEGFPIMIVFCIKYGFNGFNGICGSLQVALGRTDVGLRWTIYYILSTFISYYITALFGVTEFLIGIVIMIFVNIIVAWHIQFKTLVKIRLIEYIEIFYRPLIISAGLSVMIYCIAITGSLIYTLLGLLLACYLYLMLLIRTQDGIFLCETIRKIPVISKYISQLKNILIYDK